MAERPRGPRIARPAHVGHERVTRTHHSGAFAGTRHVTEITRCRWCGGALVRVTQSNEQRDGTPQGRTMITYTPGPRKPRAPRELRRTRASRRRARHSRKGTT